VGVLWPTTAWFTGAAVVAGLAGAMPERPAVGLTAALVVGVGALLAVAPRGLGIGGVLHVAYLGITVSLPLVGFALCARGNPAGSLLLVPAPIGWYATHVEPYRLRVDRATLRLPDRVAGTDTVRIGVIADLQTDGPGPHEHHAVDLLLAEEPDLILLAGDVFQGTPAELSVHEDAMRALLGRLHAPHGVYLVRGDHDPGDYADRLVHGTRVTVLDDKEVDVPVGDRRLRLGGNRLRWRHPDAVALRRQLDSDAPDDGTLRILLAHRPDAALDLRPAPGSRIDLVVAGHTHGGQIVVPGFGPLMTATRVPRHVAAGGLHEIDGNPIYVGTGVGLERGQAPQLRLFCRPSVGVLDLA